MRTQAAITDGKGHFTIDEIEVDEAPVGDEVLVRIEACGVCHTDHDSLTWGPSVIGHEGAGVVEAVGPDVRKVAVGDRVLLNWAIPCGRCFQCWRGNYICCESSERSARKETTLHKGEPIGRCFGIGVLAGATVVREAAVTRIDVDVPAASACLLGCGVMTGFGAVTNVARCKPGEHIAVIGVGGVGLSAIQGGRVAQAGTVIAIDVNPDKLAMAERFGATHCIQAERDDHELGKATEQVRALTDGRGADYTFECSGVPALSRVPPLKMVRPRGNAYLLSNIEHELEFSLLHFTKDRSFMRPTYGWCCPDVDFPVLLELYGKQQLYLDEMVTQTYRIDDLQQAFDDMFAGKNARGVVVFE